MLCQSYTGYAHCLSGASNKAKRISHRTSHAETLAAYNGQSGSQNIALRITEIFLPGLPHRQMLTKLLAVQDNGDFLLPEHNVTDCNDLLELVCGERGIPADKQQRLRLKEGESNLWQNS